MARTNRHFLPSHVWHVRRSYASLRPRHKNIRVQNTTMSQKGIPTEILAGPKAMDILVV